MEVPRVELNRSQLNVGRLRQQNLHDRRHQHDHPCINDEEAERAI